jgi:hypothetical protein
MWVTTLAGKSMPLDVEPFHDGLVVLVDTPHGRRARVLGAGEEPSDVTRYTSHFATCPQAGSWRR